MASVLMKQLAPRPAGSTFLESLGAEFISDTGSRLQNLLGEKLRGLEGSEIKLGGTTFLKAPSNPLDSATMFLLAIGILFLATR